MRRTMKDLRRKIASFGAIILVIVPLIITVYLLYWSPHDSSARQTGKQRVFGATYMTMNNPYFQMLDAQIQDLLELNKPIEKLTADDLCYIGAFASTAASLSTETAGGIPSIPEKSAVLAAM